MPTGIMPYALIKTGRAKKPFSTCTVMSFYEKNATSALFGDTKNTARKFEGGNKHLTCSLALKFISTLFNRHWEFFKI